MAAWVAASIDAATAASVAAWTEAFMAASRRRSSASVSITVTIAHGGPGQAACGARGYH
jgi:hypothetical protein